jgi:hypothetical protein
MSDADTITFLYGHKELKITLPTLVTRYKTKKFLWFKWEVPEYWIEYEYIHSGPYSDLDEANEMFRYALAAYR